MTRYIDAYKLHYKKIYVSTGYDETKQAVVVFAKEIDKCEAEDLKPVLHAHYINTKFNDYECSNCHIHCRATYNSYCPNCGAKMDEEVDGKCNI